MRSAFGEGFVMSRALGHLSDILHFTLTLPVAVRINQFIRKVTLESGRVLLDRSLPPTFSGLAHCVSGIGGEGKTGHGQ